MTKTSNPYSVGFGRIPSHYISRDLIIDDIVENLNSDTVQGQAYKITGVRGTGKTVTLSALEKKINEYDTWIVAGVRPDGDITEDLIGTIYNEVPLLSSFFSKELNLSKFGIGVNIKNVNPVSSPDAALKKILTELKKKGKRLLVTIDEVKNTVPMRRFVQEFQLLIRQDLPIFLVVAGLYNDIDDLENEDQLTFFLRAEKYEMTPLNYTIIRLDYQKTLDLDQDVAETMALITKGYAFAYQALGRYMWEAGSKEVTEDVLAKLDEALSEKVYRKIWSELTKKERWFLRYIVKKDTMPVNELLELTGQKKNQFSKPRQGLKNKGIIDTSVRGMISLRLPRFREFVEIQIKEEV
ncbi:MAG: ATP-binding protein [Lachnospiraceae bacterium]|nr:ATP-binding protein [Lachnospiraceae bacterium]